MNVTISNYFNLAEPEDWKCALQSIEEGVVTVEIKPTAVSKARLALEFWNVIYHDVLMGWQRCNLSVATSEELLRLLPNLGDKIRGEISDEAILESYKLFVFPATPKNVVLVAQDTRIVGILP